MKKLLSFILAFCLVPAALAEIGYPYWDESDNPAYQLFLG